MLSVVSEAFFTQYIERAFYVKGMKWYVWLFALSLIALLGFLVLYAYPNTQKFRYIACGVICGVTSIVYFKQQKNKNMRNQLGDEKNAFHTNLQLMRRILIENHILTLEQLNLLIRLADNELSGLRLSERLKKWLYGVISAILIPSTTFVSTLIGNYQQTIHYVMQVFALVLLLFVIYQPVKYLLYWSLDRKYHEMLVVKRYLENIKIMDYVR